MDGATINEPQITVYWRPGCAFCAMLRRSLARSGVPTTEVNIWKDAHGAAAVRRAASGNETVPTVDIAGTVLVNPSAEQVVSAATRAGIELPEPPERRRFGRRPR